MSLPNIVYNLIIFLVSSLVQECTIGIGMLCYDKGKSCHLCLLCTSAYNKLVLPKSRFLQHAQHATVVLHGGEISSVLLQCIVSKSIQFTMKAVINQVGGWLHAHVDEEPDKIES